MELLNWSALSGSTGAALAVSALTQLTKDLPGVRRLPTQLWSYFWALITLLLALIFENGFSIEGSVLAAFNAALVSLAANGGYAAIARIRSQLSDQA